MVKGEGVDHLTFLNKLVLRRDANWPNLTYHYLYILSSELFVLP
jgi:hypothetical protein